MVKDSKSTNAYLVQERLCQDSYETFHLADSLEGYRLTRNQKQFRSSLPRKAKRKLLEPGYWGHLEDEELEFIQTSLQNNPKLSYVWGFQPVQKSRSPEAIRRVAMWGDPKDREVNTKAIRRSRMRV